MKKAALLINLGTPSEPTTTAVRDYLAEFLMDPYVIDIPGWARWLLVHGIILRTRPPRSAEAYRKVWAPEGSPLAIHHRALQERVAACLGDGWRVRSAMRYGQPSIESQIDALAAENPDEWVIFPLYPQYSLAATESSVELALKVLRKRMGTAVRPVRVIESFFNYPSFIESFASVARSVLASFRPDQVLFSFHGLPERQIHKARDPFSDCLKRNDCCDRSVPVESKCYRAQCWATARSMAAKLDLPAERFRVSFQSRLGRTPWIQPFTDVVLDELASAGVRRLAVVCPSFVADCLETLEEIQIRAREQFRSRGGEDLILVPSLNASDEWIEAVSRLVRGEGVGAVAERRYSVS